jgi:hypothetical protein
MPSPPTPDLEVLLVRHGESQNNVIMRALISHHLDPLTRRPVLAEFEKEWLLHRQDDPPISTRGQQESSLLAAALCAQVSESQARGASKVRAVGIARFVLACDAAAMCVCAYLAVCVQPVLVYIDSSFGRVRRGLALEAGQIKSF